MEIKSVGVLGAGQMGAGIAHVVALHGYDVAIYDVAPDRLQACLDNIKKNLARQVSKEHIDQAAMDKASPTSAWRRSSRSSASATSPSRRRPRTKRSRSRFSGP